MKRLLASMIGVALGIGLMTVAPAAVQRGHNVLEFNTMAPVTGPFLGSSNAIRGVGGGGLPWQIDRAQGELSKGGHLEINVKGLVLLEDDPVPAELQGTNPVANFVGIVSCQTITNGAATVTNVATNPFAATATGNAHVSTRVSLPSDCIAPIVFVGASPTAWLAVTGR